MLDGFAMGREIVVSILREHPEGMTIFELCAELRRRGLADDSLSGAAVAQAMGSKPENVLKLVRRT